MTQYKKNNPKINASTKPPKAKAKKRIAKSKEKRRDPMTTRIYEKLLLSADLSKYTGKRDYLAYSLLWALGIRVNELKHFYYNNWNELIQTSKTTIQEPKTHSSKEVVISQENKAHLLRLNWADDWFQTHTPAPLLRNHKGKPLNDRYVIRMYNRKIKPLGEENNLKLRTHSFRIGLITRLLQTTNPLVVKDIIGHKTIDTTLRYNRGTTSTQRKIEALNQAEMGM